jgi:hypothetical protein
VYVNCTIYIGYLDIGEHEFSQVISSFVHTSKPTSVLHIAYLPLDSVHASTFDCPYLKLSRMVKLE